VQESGGDDSWTRLKVEIAVGNAGSESHHAASVVNPGD
jgi:hypothetical protein